MAISSLPSTKQNKQMDAETWICPTCGKGLMHPHAITKELHNPDGTIAYIPDIKVDICNLCGEQVYDVKVIRAIESHKKNWATVNLRLPFLVYRNLEIQAHQNGHSLEEEISRVLVADYNCGKTPSAESK